MKISNRYAVETTWYRKINGKIFEFIADDVEIIVKERVVHKVRNGTVAIWRHRHVFKREV